MLRTSPTRVLPSLIALVVVGALSACGSSSTRDDGRTVTARPPNPSVARSLEPTPAPPSVGPPPTAGPGGDVTLAGVTVAAGLDPDAEPRLTSSSAQPAPGLLVQDLIVGGGEAATPTSSVTLHYTGVLYSDGKQFDTNWSDADPDALDLATSIAGFAQGVGGTAGVAPMAVGGRRLLVFPASLGYGAIPQGVIPAHSSLVFVVELLGLP